MAGVMPSRRVCEDDGGGAGDWEDLKGVTEEGFAGGRREGGAAC